MRSAPSCEQREARQQPGEGPRASPKRGTAAARRLSCCAAIRTCRGDEVEPAFRRCSATRTPDDSRPPQTAHSSAGRRTVLADWIASPENPLTARVMVNRVWQHHFGRGIVRSPNNFGELGTPPTHPELLDWLASELVDDGWQLKPLHRLIMTSNAYRMSSRRNDRGAGEGSGRTTCSGGSTCGGSTPRRSATRSWPSAAISISKMCGPSVYPEDSDEVLGRPVAPGRRLGRIVAGRAGPPQRLHPREALAARCRCSTAFDLADTDASCPARFTTTQPTQALAMLNGEFLNEQAGNLADACAQRSRRRRRGASAPGAATGHCSASRRTTKSPRRGVHRTACSTQHGQIAGRGACDTSACWC